MEPVSETRFEQLVDEALEAIPEELREQCDNVAIVVEDRDEDEPDLLGVYEGIPLTERLDYAGALPDVIRVFRLPLCAYARTTDELVDEIYVTVVHELAHHVGIDDERLHELGWA